MSARITPDRADTPAVALGPVSLVLGIVAAVGAWPALTLALLPLCLIAGGLAVTFGLMGMYHAGRGVGSPWTAATGTVLGAAGLTAPFILVVLLSA
ncbi:hypothetical protein [Streptomyces roseochromogenus]|uniref:Uncharacterized protein n=1 Tax=Streptomyces roseochromogenus subsp. oscitans DS 12.976 TaxID=1352936 RepID=V6KTJ2_STRRC|nr:hypothetical protein [Streptomyces roseochromogenus]EST35338.1 hypothetical protein M878_06490 [Streptomyces roseochromogenus subsp. oscitans DS 12.976]